MSFSRPSSYILHNISKYDLNISDLGVRIPLGKSKDLLDPKLGLKWENIVKSKNNGSISLRIKKGMLEEIVGLVNDPSPPSRVQVIRETTIVKLPDRVNSKIVVEIGDLSEEIEKISMSEDDELLKQLDLESMMEESGDNLFLKDED